MLLTTLSVLVLQQAPVQVVRRDYCPGSMCSEPDSGCKSWNPYETAGPLFDAERDVVYVGGADGFLHVISSKSRKLEQNYALPGNLVSTPVLRQNYLYFGTDQGYLVCFDLAEKQIKWEHKIGAEVLSSPVFDSSFGYVVTVSAVLNAFAPETGEVVWQKTSSLSKLPLGKPSTPFVAGDKLIWGTGFGQLEFLSLSDGSKLFDVSLGDSKRPFPEIISPPVSLAGGKIAVAAFNQGIFVLDPKGGVIEWSLQSVTQATQLASRDNILVAAGPGFVVGIDLLARQRMWGFKFQKGSPNQLTIREGRVYLGSDLNGLYVLNLQTGEPLQILGVRGGGFAANFDFSSETTLFALSTRGYLYSYGRTQTSSGRRAYSSRRSGPRYGALAK